MTVFLANHLWQSTLVAVLAWLATLALRRNRAGVRYAIWLAASLKFLVPLSAIMTFGARFGWRPIVVASFVPDQMVLEAGGSTVPTYAVRLAAMQTPTASTLHR